MIHAEKLHCTGSEVLYMFSGSSLSRAVGWGRDYRNEGFVEQGGVKHQLVAVVTAVQTLLRGE